MDLYDRCNSAYRLRYWNNLCLFRIRFYLWLQQCLPFAVLKPTLFVIWSVYTTSLQQCLPLAVLKLSPTSELSFFPRCNSAYRLRYWNGIATNNNLLRISSCNSTYRLRYWNPASDKISNIGFANPVATVLTACGIETPNKDPNKQQDLFSCNSTYRLRYWNLILVNLPFLMFLSCNSTYCL